MEWARPLDVVETAYRLDGTDDDWIRGLRTFELVRGFKRSLAAAARRMS
jgi:hypothetical protein